MMQDEGCNLSFVRNNPFFKKDAEKRMSTSLSAMDIDTVVQVRGTRHNDNVEISHSQPIRREEKTKARQTIVGGHIVTLRGGKEKREIRELMSARRETVEILMEEIVRENMKREEENDEDERRRIEEEKEREERSSINSASDLEYGPGIVEKLKAKFTKFSRDDPTRTKKAKRYRSVDDILNVDDSNEGNKYIHFHIATTPERTSQTLDRDCSPRKREMIPSLQRRTSRSMADMTSSDECDHRSFVVHRQIVRRKEEEIEDKEESKRHRLSFNPDDMVDIRELKRLFDQPSSRPWRPSEPHRERFIEKGRTHQTVPPSVHDTRDVPPPRDVRLSAPSRPIDMDPPETTSYDSLLRPSRRTIAHAAVMRRESREKEEEIEEKEEEPEFVRIGKRLRRATTEGIKWNEKENDVHKMEEEDREVHNVLSSPNRQSVHDAFSIVTSPPDPSPQCVDYSSSSINRHIHPSDVSPPPEEPKPPMRPTELEILCSLPSSRFSSLSRSEISYHSSYNDHPRSESPRREQRDLLHRVRSLSRDSSLSSSIDSSSSRDRPSRSIVPKLPPKFLPARNDNSGVEEMQRMLNRFNERKEKEREEEEERERKEEEEERREEERREEEERRMVEEEERERQRRRRIEEEEKKRMEEERERLTNLTLREANGIEEEKKETKPRFVPAIVGIRCSDGRQLLSSSMNPSSRIQTSSSHISSSAPPLNVVSISVRDSTPSVIYTNERRSDEEDQVKESCLSIVHRKSSIGSFSCTSSSEEDEDKPMTQQISRKSIPSRLDEKIRCDIPPPLPSQSPPSTLIHSTLPNAKPYGDDEIIQVEVLSAREEKTNEVEEDEASMHELPVHEVACTPTENVKDTVDTICEEEDEKETGDGDIIEIEEEVIEEKDEDYGIDEIERTEEELETSDDEGDVEDIANRQLKLDFASTTNSLLAGDGNPVRHSILHLAMDEDVPALLEAMSETYEFEFEDVHSSRPSTSKAGIIKKERSTRKMMSIAFEPVATGVYTYLDESSAEGEEWTMGAAVTYNQYQEMCITAEEEEYRRGMDELARWNAAIQEASAENPLDSLPDIPSSRHIPLIFST